MTYKKTVFNAVGVYVFAVAKLYDVPMDAVDHPGMANVEEITPGKFHVGDPREVDDYGRPLPAMAVCTYHEGKDLWEVELNTGDTLLVRELDDRDINSGPDGFYAIVEDDEPRTAFEAWVRANVPGVDVQRMGDITYFVTNVTEDEDGFDAEIYFVDDTGGNTMSNELNTTEDGYGALDLNTEGSTHTLSVDVSPSVALDEAQFVYLLYYLEQAVKQWLAEDAPQGTKTTRVCVSS